MDEILYITTLTAAEAVYESNPSKSIEEWVEVLESKCALLVPDESEKRLKMEIFG